MRRDTQRSVGFGRPLRRFLGLLAAAAILLAAAPVAAAQGTEPIYRSLFGVNPRLAVWVIAQLELLFAAFLLGVPLFASIAEVVGWRTGDVKYDRLAKEFTSLLTVTSAITALLGGLLAFVLMWSYPHVSFRLAEVFGPVMAVFGLLLFAEVFVLYIYYYTWDRMPKGRHIALGIALNIIGTLLMAIPNSWTTYMMSPAPGSATGWDAVTNPLWMPLNIHRFVGNVMFGGFVVGAYAAVRFLGSRTAAARAYYDWMGYVGNFVGVAALIPLPFAGYYLGREIYSFDPVMGNNMMGGAFSWPFVIQGFMVGMIFILVNFYLWNGMGRIAGAERYMRYLKYVNAALIICFAIWLTPHNLPLSGEEQARLGGAYHPLLQYLGLMAAKNAAINLIIIATFASFLMYRRANKRDAVSVRSQGRTAFLPLLVPLGLVLLTLGWYATKLAAFPTGSGKEDIVVIPIVLLVSMMVLAVVAVVLALTDRGKLGQALYIAGGIVASVLVLGPYGFVVMTQLNAFLREIAVSQWLIVMTVLVLGTSLDVVLYRGAESVGGIQWGRMPPRSQYALIGLAVTAVVTMCWMGMIRSGLRENWHIYGVMRDTSEWATMPPIGTTMLIVGAIVLVFFVMVAAVFGLAGLARGKDTAATAAASSLLAAAGESEPAGM